MTISRSKQKSRTKSKTPETSLQIPEETKNQGSGLGLGKPELPPAVPSPAVGCCIWRRSQRKSGNNSQKPPKSPKDVQEETPRLNFDRRTGVENQVARPNLDRDQAEFLDKSENQPIRHDAFHYFGVPLQSSKDNYTFLRQPSQPRFSQDEVRNVGNRSPPYLSATLPSPNKPGKPAAPDQPRAVVLATSKGGKRKNSGANVTDLRHRQRPNSEVLSSGVDFVDGNANKIERKSKRSSTASPSKEHPQSTPKFTLCPTTACCSRQSDTHSVDKNAPRTRSESLGAGQRRKSKVNPLMGRVTVTLERRDGTQLGLGIAGGTDRQIPPTISYLRPGFIAHRCDQLQVGERLLSVNGISLHTLSHTQIMAVLRNSGPTVTLEVEYDLNGPSFHRPPPATTLQRCAEIVLEEDAPETNGQNSTEQGLFGVTLRGGAYGPDPTKSRPLTVTAIRMGSSAHREGRLRIGDRILAISGLDVSNRTLATAQNLLRGDIVQFPSQKGSPRSKVTHLTVEYDVSVLATLRKARGPLLLEVEKVPGVDFGLVLAIKKPKMNTIRHGSGQTGKVAPMQQKIRSIFVQGIVRASVADRCGAIHVGDELLAVDGISLELTGSLAEVYQLLRSQCPILRLELLPSNQVAPSSPLICEGSPVIPRHHSPAFLSHNTGYRSTGQASASGSDQRDGRAVARKVIRPNTVLHKRVDSNTSTSSCSPPDVKERNRKFPFPAPQDRHNAAMGNSISNLDSNPRKSRNGLSTSRSPPRRAKPKAAAPQMSTSLYNGNIGSVSERPFENKFPLSTSVSGKILDHNFNTWNFNALPKGESSCVVIMCVAQMENVYLTDLAS
ncbi:PDZ domain (Also known as DHR or GLGF) domain-containing protein [Ditylenchus destructor]|nr:PDZ domain (Also known as DHR or GLGF) domain-containing protein [Ditylenchus destructor]